MATNMEARSEYIASVCASVLPLDHVSWFEATCPCAGEHNIAMCSPICRKGRKGFAYGGECFAIACARGISHALPLLQKPQDVSRHAELQPLLQHAMDFHDAQARPHDLPRATAEHTRLLVVLGGSHCRPGRRTSDALERKVLQHDDGDACRFAIKCGGARLCRRTAREANTCVHMVTRTWGSHSNI